MKLLSVVSGFLSLMVAAIAADAPSKSDATGFRSVDPNNLVLIDTKYGEVAVELAPQFAPKHIERLRALVRAHFYDGKSFYRVVDGFVAQGGAGEGTASTGGAAKDKIATDWPPLKAEFDAPINGLVPPVGTS